MGNKGAANRCKWVNLKNPAYIRYHDTEWGVPQHKDEVLFEMLFLEWFQAGLSWECILNKREGFRRAFDGFDAEKISRYEDGELARLLAGTLAYDPDTTCAHHEHHGEGHEGCHGHHGEGHTCGGHCGH